jgi:hypothetical protein
VAGSDEGGNEKLGCIKCKESLHYLRNYSFSRTYSMKLISQLVSCVCVCVCVCVALRPNAVHGLLMHEVSRSHTMTHHSR